MKVLKFGGSSVATPERIRQVAGLIREAAGESYPGVDDCRADSTAPVAVVVSAFGGVTNDLLAAAAAAARRDPSYREFLKALGVRHLEAARELAPESEVDGLVETLGLRLSDLGNLLHGAFLLRECSPRTRDGIVSYGERLSALVVAAALRADGVDAEVCDSRTLIVTDDAFGHAQVDFEATYDKIRAGLRDWRAIPILPGFVGATPEGQTTTLGRGGSDYTAALVGAALEVEAIELWTDVDGVMSADPRRVEQAFPLPTLSYTELMEMSHFGAKVVFPPTIHPARKLGIPLVIKNTLNPAAAGTWVREEAAANEHAVRGISSIPQVALMRLEGDGMVGVPGVAARLFGALARQGVSVILISQASSEHSICFAVAPDEADRARVAIDREFALEKQAGMIDELVLEGEQAVIAAVGDGMGQRPGIAGRLFQVLGEHRVNVRAIAQGSSELNISLVIDRADEARALNAIHGAFFDRGRRRVAVALLGPGRVGAALLEQLEAASAGLAEEGLDLRLVAVAGSRQAVFDGDGIDGNGLDLATWREQLGSAPPLEAEAGTGDALVDFLRDRPENLRVFVDCTASGEAARWYGELLRLGVAVVAANKLAFADSLDAYRELQQAARQGEAPLLFEATAGAGLPVLRTLEDLGRTGHRVERIEGVLSGTVNAVLDRLAAGESFSVAVRGAHADGLTEPHPYEDLSGGDVARKLLILARLSGRSLEPEAVRVEPLLAAEPWGALDLEAFWNALPDADAEFERRQRQAAEAGARLRYVAAVEGEGARVELRAVPSSHPAYGLGGPDNLIAFSTQHYADRPLVIRGPGAGPAVTASGVFSDLLEAIRRLERTD